MTSKSIRNIFIKSTHGAIAGVIVYILSILASHTIFKGIDVSMSIGAQIVLVSALIGLILGIVNLLISTVLESGLPKSLFDFLIACFVGGGVYYSIWMYPDLSIKDDVYLTILVVGVLNGLLIFLLNRLLVK